MSIPPIRLPSGVRDFLPRAAARRRALAERAMEVFESWGYARVVTPIFERADVLERGLGRGAKSAALRFVEPGTGEVVALRPDITPQIARIVATRLAEVEGPIRLCYEGAVTRLAEGGQHEILQAGIELVDAHEPEGDAEVLAIAAAALAASQLPETRLDVGHVAPVRHVLEAAPEAETRARLETALARKDRAGLRSIARLLPDDVAPLAEALGSLWGPADTTLARANALPWPSKVKAALAELEATLVLYRELADTPAVSGAITGGAERSGAITIDLGDVRGFDYYTGIRFAGYAGGAPDAVLRGGRYDELIGRYGRPARATGFALDLEALAQAQRTVGIDAPAAVRGVAIHGRGAAALARELRGRGVRAVACATQPTERWLRDANLDAAILVDAREVMRADGSREPVQVDAASIDLLLQGDPCPS